MEGVARRTYLLRVQDKLGGAGVVGGIGQSNLVVSYAHVRGGNFNFWQLHVQRLLQVKSERNWCS